MQTILYNKQTKKIVNVFQDAEVNGNKIKHEKGTVYFGDGLGVIFVTDDTVKIKEIIDGEKFTPNSITKLKTETPPKTLESRIKDLEKDVKELKTLKEK